MNIDAQARLLATQALQNDRSQASGDKRQKMADTAQQFEAIFVQQIFKGMRSTVPEGGLLPRSNAEEIYTDMQDMEAARQLTRQGGIGLAAMLVEQMQKTDK